MPARRALIAGICLAASTVAAPAAADANGGAVAPSVAGGAQVGDLGPAPRPGRLVVRTLRVSPTRLPASGGRPRVAFRVDGGVPTARVTIAVTRNGTRIASAVITRRTGRTYSRTLALGTGLPSGDYVVSLKVADRPDAADRLRARAAASTVRLHIAAPPKPKPAPTPAPKPPAPAPPPAPKPAAPAPSAGGVFPVRGWWSFGGDGSLWGSDRGGRLHRGQDIAAAEGTPLVSPKAGYVHWRAYQAAGAGHYVVIRGDDGRDYVFMHMRVASPLAPGARVAPGTPIGEVGNTGGSSGPHLHFEIWPSGWYASPSSQPIDPLPTLRAWAGL